MLTKSRKDEQIAAPDPSRLCDPHHWLDLAEEARSKGEQMSNLSAIATMRWVANEYDRLAGWADKARVRPP